jgi:hypothetical protein
MRRAPGEESLCKEGASPPLLNHLVFFMDLDHSGQTTGLHVTLSRHLHLPAPTNSDVRKVPHPLQISDTLASITFRGPEYITHPSTEGIAQLVFDVPRAARTVSAYQRHGGDIEEDEVESDAFRRRFAPLFEVRGILAIRIALPIGRFVVHPFWVKRSLR